MLGERIKTVRKHLKLTQVEFGESIGVKGNTITGYENGTRTPSAAVTTSICNKYSINPIWLKTGEGPMFVDDPFKSEIISRLSSLNESDWENIKRIVAKIAR